VIDTITFFAVSCPENSAFFRKNLQFFENILAVGRPAAPLAAVKLSEKETQRKTRRDHHLGAATARSSCAAKLERGPFGSFSVAL
jgi:hypothetical protein